MNTERYPEPKTATEKQAAQVRRLNGVRSVAEAEAVAERAAPKSRTKVETGDHRPAERAPKMTATERQADAILRGL